MERDFLSLNWNGKYDVHCNDSVNRQTKSSSTLIPAAFPFIKTTEGNSAATPPMTIFYSGAIHVYHHISPQKVDAIMKMAANGLSETKQTPKPNGLTETKQFLKPEGIISKISHQIQPYPTQNSSETFKKGDIAMARKATLARFLKNRKVRLINGMPYNDSGKLSGTLQSSSANKI